MKIRFQFALWVSLMAISALAACSATKMQTVWKEPQFQSRTMKKVLVIGVSQQASIKRLFEDEFAGKIRSHGVDAYPGYLLFPGEAKPSKEEMAAAIAEGGIDSVFITHLVEKKNVQTYIPGSTAIVPQMGAPMFGYYSSTYDHVTTPGYTIDDEVAVVETNIYDAVTQELLWTGTSDTTLDQSRAESAIKDMVAALAKKVFE